MNNSAPYSINILLSFEQATAQGPWVCRVAKLFDVEFSITKANVSAKREGSLVLDLHGTEEECNKAIAYLKENNIGVTPVAQSIWHNEEKCIDCGLCTALCPTSALDMNEDNHLSFDKQKCVVCLNCTLICPVHAMQSDFAERLAVV